MASWPSQLPGPLSRSLTVSPRDNVIAFRPDRGVDITRRATTARLVDYQAQLLLTET